MQFEYQNQPGIGLRATTVRSQVWNRTSDVLFVGDVVMTDTLATQSESSKTQTNNGADDYPLNNVIVPTTAGIGVLTADPGYWFGVVENLGTAGTGADNTKVGVVWISERVDVLITTGTTSEYGKPVYPADGADGVTTTQVDGVKALGRVLVDTTTSAAVSPCMWDGIHGIGTTYLT